MVLVENATRLARDLMISEIILGEFRKIGVKVISADGGIDLTLGDDDPSGKLIRQMLGAVRNGTNVNWSRNSVLPAFVCVVLGNAARAKNPTDTLQRRKIVDSILSLRKQD